MQLSIQKKSIIPIHIVMIPLTPTNKLVDRLPDMPELISGAQASLKTIKSQQKKEKNGSEVYSKIIYLGSCEKGRDLRNLFKRLTVKGAILYISAHGFTDRIGTMHSFGIDPITLATNIFQFISSPEHFSKLQEVRFLTCNSGYSPEKHEESYAGRFATAMKSLGAKSLTVVGYLGYLEEDGKHKHTYTSIEFEDNKKPQHKHRIETQAVTFHPDGKITTPKHPIQPIIRGNTTFFNPLTEQSESKNNNNINDNHETIDVNSLRTSYVDTTKHFSFTIFKFHSTSDKSNPSKKSSTQCVLI